MSIFNSGNNFGRRTLYTNKFSNPYNFSAGSVNPETSDALFQAIETRNRMEFDLKEERSMWDRASDLLQVGNYTTANYFSDWIKFGKGDENASFLQAINPFDDIWSGLKAANPFGSGSAEDERTYSDVIEEMGWKPTSLAGKITKGTLGFAGDVLLDPLTYLTGGVSAVIRGTGRVGDAVKALDKLSDTYNGGKKMTQMTEEVAEKIIIDSSAFQKGFVPAEEVATQAKELTDRFNKIIGLRDVDPRAITFGVENLPFGDKLAPKLGVLGKTVTLSDGNNVRKLADTIGTARAYSSVRSAIYGGRIGKMFSNNSAVYKLAQENPAGLYELVASANYAKGLSLTKLEQARLIRQKADELGALTKMEQKEIIKFLEDKTVLNKVKGVLKFAETEEAKEIRKVLERDKDSLLQEMDLLKDLRSISKSIQEASVKNADPKAMKKLTDDFLEEVNKLDVQGVLKHDAHKMELREILDKKLFDIDEQILKVDGRILKGATGEKATSELAKMANSVFDESQVASMSQKLGKAKNAPKAVAEVDMKTGKAKITKDAVDPDVKQSSAISLVERERYLEALGEVAFGHGGVFNLQTGGKLVDDTVNVLRDMLKFKGGNHADQLHDFIRVNEGFFGRIGNSKTASKALSLQMDLVQKGDFSTLFQMYINRNPNLLNTHAKEAYSLIANKLGYKSFYDDILSPYKELMEKRKNVRTPITEKEMARLRYYEGKMNERAKLLEEYHSGITHGEFISKISGEQLRELRKNYEEMLDLDESKYLVPEVEKFTARDAPIDAVKSEGLRYKGDIESVGVKWEAFEHLKEPLYHPATFYNKEPYIALNGVDEIPAGTKHISSKASRTMPQKLHDASNIESRFKQPELADPRGIKSNNVKYQGKEWEVFTNTDGAKYYYNLEDYTYSYQIGDEVVEKTINAGSRHIRNNTLIEPLADHSTPKSKSYAREEKIVTRKDLHSHEERSYVQPHAEKQFIAEHTNKHGMEGLDKAMRGITAKANKLVNDMGEVMLELYPGKSFRDIKTTEEIDKLVKFTRRVGMMVGKGEGKYRAIRRNDVRKVMRGEEIVNKSLAKAERAVELQKHLDHGKTVDVIVDGKPYQGAINSIRYDKDKNVVYTLRQGDEYVEFNVGDVQRITPDARLKTIREMTEEDKTIKELIKIREATLKEMEEIDNFVKGRDEVLAKREALVEQHQANRNALKRDITYMERAYRKAQDELSAKFGGSADDYLKNIPENANIDDIERYFDANIEHVARQIEGVENKMKTDEALEMYAREIKGNDFVDDLTSAIALDVKASTENVAKYYRILRETFNQAGKAEVEMGKLDAGKFLEMMSHYLPRVPTKDGSRYFASIREFKEHKPRLTGDFGYGMEWNPHAKTRSLDADTVREANDIFREKLKGKNAFSENIAEIYIKRMLKHEDLRYDQEYMHMMTDIFGKEITGEVEKGYKAVANYGLLRKHFTNEARLRMRDRIRLERAYSGRKDDFTNDEMMKFFEEEVESVVRHYGFEPDVLDKYALPMVELTSEQATRLSRLTGKQLENLGAEGLARQVNESIVQQANQARHLAIMKDEHRALQMYDKFLHFMKLNQTAIMPAFHVRNKASNMFQNWLGVGRDAFDVRFQTQAHKAVMWVDDVEKLRSLPPIVTDDGKHVIHWDELVKQAFAHKAMDEGFFAKDIGAGAITSGLFKGKIPPRANWTDTGNFIGYEIGTKVGSQIENADRLLHFASMVKQGKSFKESADSSIKYLFDYSDLTAFEQSVMKRIFPYYTWMRKNMRLQVTELIDQPNKYALLPKLQNWIEGMNNQEDRVEQRYLSDFARDWVQTPFGMYDKDGQRRPVMMNPNLPFMDIAGLPDPFNPMDSLREFFSQTAPQLKVPVEQLMNKNMYFNSPIVDEGESQISNRLEHLAGQFAPYNAYKGATGKPTDEEGLMHAMGSLTGLKMTPYNYDMQKRIMLQEYIKSRLGDDY